jgi:hypothetical protein
MQKIECTRLDFDVDQVHLAAPNADLELIRVQTLEELAKILIELY